MGGELKPTESVSCATYQYFDGSNYSLAQGELSFKKNAFSFGSAAGVGTNFKSSDLVIDLKGAYKYHNCENFSAGTNIRFRGKANEDTQSLQIRVSPFTCNFKICKNVTGYANLNYAAKINSDGQIKHSVNVFAGADIKLNKHLTISPEIERDNLQNINNNNGSNWSGNIIAKWTF